MKRAVVISFTRRGGETAQKVAAALSDEFSSELLTTKNTVGELFSHVDLLVFVGACGIAVRAIAPYVRSKAIDPAVIVLDERGIHVISLLSGHIGGANELTRRIASALNACPVITTATDINGKFSADEWAVKHNAAISSMKTAKRFAAEILNRDLPLHCEFPVEGALAGGLFSGDEGALGVSISCHRAEPFAETLRLTPRILHIGIGCKRDTPVEKIRTAVDRALESAHLSREALVSAASIDVKKDEAGLLAFCEENHLPVTFYSAETLKAVNGEFTASAFVRSTVGVDNVCERAAVCDAREGAQLILKKTCLDGVTVAVAQEKWSVSFEQ